MLLTLFFYFGLALTQHSAAFGFGSALHKKTKKGNELFEQGKFDEALAKYTDAQLHDPESGRLHFNIGDVFYKTQKYEKAREEFTNCLNNVPVDIQSQAYYNIGNSYFRENKLVEAIAAYKKALELNPEDEDAKYNLELSRRILKEQAQKQQQQQQQQQKQQQNQDSQEQQEQKQAGTEAQKNNSPEEEKKQQQEKNEQEQQQPGQQQQKGSESKQEDISEEDAIRILKALEEDEKELLKEQREIKQQGGYSVDKDW